MSASARSCRAPLLPLVAGAAMASSAAQQTGVAQVAAGAVRCQEGLAACATGKTDMRIGDSAVGALTSGSVEISCLDQGIPLNLAAADGGGRMQRSAVACSNRSDELAACDRLLTESPAAQLLDSWRWM